MELWNRVSLSSPPFLSEQYVQGNLNKGLLRDVHTKLFSSVEAHKACEGELAEEIQFLSRIYYKFKNQWRREKCLRNIKQVEVLLKKYQHLNITNKLSDLLSLISGKLSRSDEHIYLPSRALVECTLVQLMGVAQLLQRVCSVSETGYRNISMQLSAGLFVQNMTIIAAIFSKTFSLCKSLNEVVCQCYTSLKTWLPELRPTATSFITSPDDLPDDITSWLTGDSANTCTTMDPGNDSSSVADKTESADVPTKVSNKNNNRTDETLLEADGLNDIGQVIDRASFSSVQRPSQSTDVSLAETLCDLSFPAGKKVKKFLKSVLILGDEDSDDDKTECRAVLYAELSMSEFYSWKVILRECDSVKSVKQVIKQINSKYSKHMLRGMKVCVRKLKELKPGIERKKNKDNRKKQKYASECLKAAQKCVRVMLKKNVKDFVEQKCE